jgi:hypothetical protein
MAKGKSDRPDPADLAAMGMTPAEFMAEYDAAVASGEREMPDETAIRSAAYDPVTARVVIDLAGGLSLLVPVAKLQALAGASPDDLARVEILGSHSLDWPTLGQSVYVPDLLRGITGTRAWMASQLGRKGGAAKSPAKSAAARANGAKGGRPRKLPPAAGE